MLWIHDKQELCPGDSCFYLSGGKVVPTNILLQFMHNLVVHESDLPRGKVAADIWQILEGENRIPATLFEAVEKVVCGHKAVWS